MITHPTLYGKAKSGKTRFWHMEQDGDHYRSVSGTEGGAEVRSGWQIARPKNVGQSNATDGESQATSQIESQYRVRCEQGGYSVNREEAGKKSHFAPMLAAKWSDQKDQDQILARSVVVQPKLDGVRCIAKADGLWSRNGKPILGAPHIIDALADFFEERPDAILDGELYNHDFKDDFDSIISCIKKQKPSPKDLALSKEVVQYHVYDMPLIQREDGSVDIESSTIARCKTIEQIVDSLRHSSIHLVESIICNSREEIDEAYGRWLEDGYEGQMVRTAFSFYQNRRTRDLLKRKEFIDEEFIVERIEEGKGNWAGAAKRVIGRLKDGRTFGAGMRGTYAAGAQKLKDAELYVGGTATIRYQNLTPDGIPRFGVCTQLYKRGEERL
jgi:DNA ligase-1